MRKLNNSFGRPVVDDNVGRFTGVLLLLLTFSLIALSQTTAPKSVSQTSPSPKKEQIKVSPLTLLVRIGGPPDFKLTLNGEDMGKASDPSRLITMLADTFRMRREQRVYKLGSSSNEIEKIVTVKSDRAIKYGDYIKVIKAIKDAGAEPLALATDEKKVPMDPNAEPQAKRRDEEAPAEEPGTPNSTPKSEPQVAVIREITTIAPGATASVEQVIENQRIDPGTIKNSAAVLEVRNDGEYYLGGKRVEKAAIYQELSNRFKDIKEDDVVTYIVAGGGLSYGSVEDGINEVWEANRRLILVTAPAQAAASTAGSGNWTPIVLAIGGVIGGLLLLGLVLFVVAKRRR